MESSLWSASQAASLVGVIRRISFLNYILASAVSFSRSEQSEQSRAVQQQNQSSQSRAEKRESNLRKKAEANHKIGRQTQTKQAN